MPPSSRLRLPPSRPSFQFQLRKLLLIWLPRPAAPQTPAFRMLYRNPSFPLESKSLPPAHMEAKGRKFSEIYQVVIANHHAEFRVSKSVQETFFLSILFIRSSGITSIGKADHPPLSRYLRGNPWLNPRIYPLFGR